MILNIDKSWHRLVKWRAKLLRRPQVTTNRPPVAVNPTKKSKVT